MNIILLDVKISIGCVIQFEAGGEQSKMADDELVAMDLSWRFSVLMLRPFFPEFVMSTDLLSFEHPSVLLFCFTDFFAVNMIKGFKITSSKCRLLVRTREDEQ